MSKYPDKISVSASRQQWVQPLTADAVFQIEGQSSVGAVQAMKKAQEVDAFIAELNRHDANGESVYVDSARFESSKGLLSASSQALFRVVVATLASDQVPLCLGVAAQQKGVAVETVRWDYGDLHDERLALLGQVTSDCLDYADAVAQSLGIVRGLLHTSDLQWQEPSTGESHPSGAMLRSANLQRTREDPGFSFPIQRRAQLAVTMRAEFRCSELE